MEASLDWKPNRHTVPGVGIEPQLSGPVPLYATCAEVGPLCYLGWILLNLTMCIILRRILTLRLH